MNDIQGFTLLEMLVVVTIMSLAGMIVGLAIPRTRELAALARAEADIIKVLKETHTQARRSSSTRRVVFDLDHRRFQIEGSQDWHSFPTGTEISIVSARELGLPRRPAIMFLGDGTNSGGDITLKSGRYAKKLRIDWLTGRVGHAAL